VILALVALLSALVFGFFNVKETPRTQVERDITYYSGLIEAGDATTEVVASYVDALRRAGQRSRAQETLDKALESAKSGRSFLLAEQARLYLADKRYKDVVEVADQAMTEADAELKAFMKANEEANRKATAGARMPTSYSTAALAKASALVAQEDYAGAIEAYDAHLEISPIDSDILCLRAQAKVETGDAEGAAEDFRAALKYIPDYQPALDGLEQIGESQ
jgi:tetratricopeptide (TPR) repeat protein